MTLGADDRMSRTAPGTGPSTGSCMGPATEPATGTAAGTATEPAAEPATGTGTAAGTATGTAAELGSEYGSGTLAPPVPIPIPLPPAVAVAYRTALTSIIGYSEVLIAEDDGRLPQRTRMLQAIEQNGHRLFALLTGGPADRTPALETIDGDYDDRLVDIAGLLVRIRETLLEALTGFEPVVTIEVTRGLRMHRDRVTGLRLATRHLVENAIKYSGPGSPVRLRATTSGGLLSLEVIDSGVGIPYAEQEKVFERFYRSAYALERRIPGHGVGLTTARNIVLRQGGTLGLRSVPGVGTTVTVTLPLGLPGEPPEPTGPAESK